MIETQAPAVVKRLGIPGFDRDRPVERPGGRLAIAPPGGQVITGGADVAKRLRVAAIRAERQELIRIWRENRISDDVLHHLEEDLDYQESRL